MTDVDLGMMNESSLYSESDAGFSGWYGGQYLQEVNTLICVVKEEEVDV